MPTFEQRLSEPSLPPAVSSTRAFPQPVDNTPAIVASAIGDVAQLGLSAFRLYKEEGDKKLTGDIAAKLIDFSKAAEQGTLSPTDVALAKRTYMRQIYSAHPKKHDVIRTAFEQFGPDPLKSQTERIERIQDAISAQNTKYAITGGAILPPSATYKEKVAAGRRFAADQAVRANETKKLEFDIKEKGVTVKEQTQAGIAAANVPISGLADPMTGMIALAEASLKIGPTAQRDFQVEMSSATNRLAIQYKDGVVNAPWYRAMLPEAQTKVLEHVDTKIGQWYNVFNPEQGALSIKSTAEAFTHFINVGKMNGSRAMDVIMIAKEVFGPRLFTSIFNAQALENIDTMGQLEDMLGSALTDTVAGRTLESRPLGLRLKTLLNTMINPELAKKLNNPKEAMELLNSSMKAAQDIEKDPNNANLTDADILAWGKERGVMGNIVHNYVNDPVSLTRAVASYTGGFHILLKRLNKQDAIIADDVADGASITAYQAAWSSGLEAGDGTLHYNPDSKKVVAVQLKTEGVAGHRLNFLQAKQDKLNKLATQINNSMALALRVADFDPKFSRIPKEERHDAFMQAVIARTGVTVAPNMVMTKFSGETTESLVKIAAHSSIALSMKFQNALYDKQRAMSAQGRGFRAAFSGRTEDGRTSYDIDPRGVIISPKNLTYKEANIIEGEFPFEYTGIPRPGAVEGPYLLEDIPDLKTTKVDPKTTKLKPPVRRSFIPASKTVDRGRSGQD